MNNYDDSIRIQKVIAGKFRRYHHLSKVQHLIIPSIIFPNIRDTFLVLTGIVQSFFRMVLWRPDVVFAKGGYVCLPVGIAAWLLRIPVVIHDSDIHPGLTNRLLAPFATRIATGMPLEHYNYPQQKTTYVGTPISSAFHPLDSRRRNEIKKALGFDTSRPLVVVTGGGQGARPINDAIMIHLKELLGHTNILLLSGSAQYDELRSLTPQDDPRFLLKDFMVQGMHEVIGAADIVVSRAGATSLLELAAAARPTIVVPSKRLVWQVKHVQSYIDTEAVISLDEDAFIDAADTSLRDTILHLLQSSTLRERLAHNIHQHARPHAARDMAHLIIGVAKKRG